MVVSLYFGGKSHASNGQNVFLGALLPLAFFGSLEGLGVGLHACPETRPQAAASSEKFGKLKGRSMDSVPLVSGIGTSFWENRWVSLANGMKPT